MAMYSREELITPDIAREYLKQNLKNRNVRQKKVKEYAGDIKAGKWTASPQPQRSSRSLKKNFDHVMRPGAYVLMIMILHFAEDAEHVTGRLPA